VNARYGPAQPAAPADDASGPSTAAAPDAHAFTASFAAHAPRVLRLLRRLGVPAGDIEDVCQEVFVVLYQRWHEFRGDSQLSTFIYGIALRKALSHRRRKHVRDSVALSEEQHLPASAPEQQALLERSEDRALLVDLLAALPDQQRELFVLYELERFSMQEIADAQSLPLHTAYSRLYAARQQLSAAAKRLREGRGES
jgi:RNA polymerase sigma-70 factor (ECF subfamily)